MEKDICKWDVYGEMVEHLKSYERSNGAEKM